MPFSTAVTTTGHAVTNASAADGSGRFAPTSIVVATGQNFSAGSAAASGTPLPKKLAGVDVDVLDAAGTTRKAGLYSVSPTSVTFVMPNGTAPGVATVTVAGQPSGALVASAAPALFSADGTGTGVALATAVRTTPKGNQIDEQVYTCSTSTTCTAVPLDLGVPGATTTVTFQATGFRNLGATKQMIAEVGGVPVPVAAAGTVSGSPGTETITLTLPHSLAGAGLVAVIITDENYTSNAVMIDIQ